VAVCESKSEGGEGAGVDRQRGRRTRRRQQILASPGVASISRGSSTLWACYLPAGPGRSTVAWPGLQKEQQGAGLKEGGAPPSIPRDRSAVENGDARLKRAIDRGAGTAKGRRLCVLLTRCT